MKQFTDIHALEKWLSRHGINFKAWGNNNSKTLDHLWQELRAGEVQLIDNPPLRLVEVVQIVIRRGEMVLVEAEQEFFNGQRRYRDLPPSEKIRPGETVQNAASRCLQEELDLPPDAFTLRPETHRQFQTNTSSISYPGLPWHHRSGEAAPLGMAASRQCSIHGGSLTAVGEPNIVCSDRPVCARPHSARPIIHTISKMCSSTA